MTSSLRKTLRAKAHSLKPVVLTGQAGLTDSVLNEIELALDHHELIKVKLRAERETRQEMCDHICEKTGAELIQSIGQVIVLYRENPDR